MTSKRIKVSLGARLNTSIPQDLDLTEHQLRVVSILFLFADPVTDLGRIRSDDVAEEARVWGSGTRRIMADLQKKKFIELTGPQPLSDPYCYIVNSSRVRERLDLLRGRRQMRRAAALQCTR